MGRIQSDLSDTYESVFDETVENGFVQVRNQTLPPSKMTFNPDKCAMYTSKRVLCDKKNQIEGFCKFHYGVHQRRLREKRLDDLRDELIVKVRTGELHWLQAEQELKNLNVNPKAYKKTFDLIKYYCGITW